MRYGEPTGTLHYVTRVQQLFVTDLGPEQKKNMAHQLVSMYNFAFETAEILLEVALNTMTLTCINRQV
jgi:hypothetical protein